jgi:transglutaminase-like putative cysteine protease
MAKKFLTQAAINKKDVLLDFSLIRVDTPILEPERVEFMEVALTGIKVELSMPEDEMQRCERKGEEVFCKISVQRLEGYEEASAADPAEVEKYLQPSHVVPSRNDLIRKTARKITTDAEITLERLRLLVEWMQKNIEKKPIDVFTALDVLSGRKAECQGNSFLYAAFARSLDIPTRVVNGIVYSAGYQGFLYHTWTESLVNGRWVAVDPTFVQLPADATHIKLIEGERPSDLLPLVDLIGKLQVRIISVDGSRQ